MRLAIVVLLVAACRGVDSPDPIPPDARVADAARPDGPFTCGPGEFTSNDGVSDFPPECCTEGAQHCCIVSFETESCLPNDEECPFFCPRSAYETCPFGTYCLVSYPPFGGPARGECLDYELDDYTTCADACDVPCGEECCGTNAVCADGCCVPVA